MPKTASFFLAAALVGTLVLAGCLNQNTSTPTPTTTSATPTPSGGHDHGPATGTAHTEAFTTTAPGGIPAGWTVAVGNWSTKVNATSPGAPNVLEQTDQKQGPLPLVIADAWGTYENFTASVKVNVLQGKYAKAGGIAFRLQDAKNFYVVRVNGNEGGVGTMDLSLFITKDGARDKKPIAEVNATLNSWHTLGVKATGNTFEFSFDGKPVGSFTDATYPVGKLALWTKDDSVTQFDDFTVTV